MAVGADTISGLAAIETACRVKAELGVNLTLSASNISFGMPDRHLLNSAFVAVVIAAGVACLIADVVRVRPMVLAADLILNRDKRARRYIEAYCERTQQRENQGLKPKKGALCCTPDLDVIIKIPRKQSVDI